MRSGIKSPVEALEPKAKAIRVTLKMDIPLSPALETPIKKAAVAAMVHAATEISEKVERNMRIFLQVHKSNPKKLSLTPAKLNK
tara:strand:+ start:91 stop:342 length:252 start_codon:yes stop_codon:yes gene_type:complete